MGTIEAKLLHLQGTKAAIKTAIEAKGVTVPVGTNFMDYAGKISSITTGGSPTADPYVRPSTWLDLPDNVAGVEKVSILYALFDTSTNMVAFTCQAAYTVDWGDGTSNNYTSGTKALHTYDYSTSGGAFVEGEIYKQVIITITPQSGAHLTYVNLNQTHTTLNNTSSTPSISGIQDIRINSSYLNNLYIGSSSNSALTVYYLMVLLEQCIIGEVGTSLLTAGFLFANCYALQNVVFNFNTAQITNWTSAFSNCFKLQKAPSIQFPATSITAMNMFNACRVLIEVPDITFNSANASYMFNDCRVLQNVKVTFTNTADTNLSYMFSACYALIGADLIFTGTGRMSNGSYMFQNCYALVTAPTISYIHAVNLASMYIGCVSLQYIPDIEISDLCSDIATMFSGCYLLQKAPNIMGVTTGLTNLTGVFNGCFSLVEIPDYDFPSVTSMNSTFSGCSSLVSIPAITTGTLTTNTSIVGSCYSLSKLTLPLTQTFSIINAKMSAEALNEMYTRLPTVATNKSITVTGNYGATSTPAISLTGALVNNSQIVTMASTSGLSVGMFATGSMITTSGSGAGGFITTSTNVIDRTNTHCLNIGDIVSFNTVASSGLPLNVIMYVVDVPTTSTFKVSLTLGGAPVVLTGDGGVVYYNTPSFITSIEPNTSVTLSIPSTSTGSPTITFRSNIHKTYIATMKKWTVTG